MCNLCVCVLASFTSFGQLLCCAHKRIVNIMKVYIERNNMHVELMRLRKKNINLLTLEVGGWVQVSRNFFFGKSSQNNPKPVLIFSSSIP